MADSYRDIAQSLLDRANLRFQSKGTISDVLYGEQVTLDRSAAIARFPSTVRPHVPTQCVPGNRHPHCRYLVLADAYRTGGDDHHDNWTLLYRVDIPQLAADSGDASLTFPDVLVNDNSMRTDERQGGGAEDTVIVWQFDVIFPNAEVIADPSGIGLSDPAGNPLVAPAFGYTKPPLYSTSHPLVAGAVLISETMESHGPVGTVTRRYVKLPTAEITGADYRNDSVLPPAKFLPSITLTTKESITPTLTGPDSSANVIESKLDAIDPARRRKTTTTASFPSARILVGSEVDMDTGRAYNVTEEVVAAGVTGSSVDGGGNYSTVEPLNSTWSIKTTRKASTLTSRTWQEIINYPWPAVLSSISITAITQGGFPVRSIVRPNWKHYAYSGPCQASVTETWTLGPPSAPGIIAMVTTPVTYQGVFFQVDVPPCLHPSFIFTETSGTSNPSYDYFIHVESVFATNYTDWPSSIYGPRSVTPYRGGYLTRQTVVFRPA